MMAPSIPPKCLSFPCPPCTFKKQKTSERVGRSEAGQAVQKCLYWPEETTHDHRGCARVVARHRVVTHHEALGHDVHDPWDRLVVGVHRPDEESEGRGLARQQRLAGRGDGQVSQGSCALLWVQGASANQGIESPGVGASVTVHAGWWVCVCPLDQRNWRG